VHSKGYTIYSLLQSYERMNIADALFSRSFEDGQLIIKQVGYMPFVKQISFHKILYTYYGNKMSYRMFLVSAVCHSQP